MDILENFDIDKYILENIDVSINIDRGILEIIDIDRVILGNMSILSMFFFDEILTLIVDITVFLELSTTYQQLFLRILI